MQQNNNNYRIVKKITITNLPLLISSSTPDCVVLGDAVDNFSYANLNKAFQTIIKAGTNKCQLFSLGKGRFYQEDGELTLDVGPFTAGILCIEQNNDGFLVEYYNL